jgi:hypothetical protein
MATLIRYGCQSSSHATSSKSLFYLIHYPGNRGGLSQERTHLLITEAFSHSGSSLTIDELTPLGSNGRQGMRGRGWGLKTGGRGFLLAGQPPT